MSGDRWTAARNLLCVRLDTLGDVLMTTPAIRALKESQPGRRITLLTSPSGAAVAPLVPEIDATIVYDAPWLKATAPRADSGPEFAMIERLRGERFDGAVIFTVFSQNPLASAFLCYMAGIPRRLAHCRENPYQLLTDWVPERDSERLARHEVRRQLDLVAAIACTTSDERMRLAIPPGAERRVRRRLEMHGIDLQRGWVVLHPGATAPSRRYPPEFFAVVARRLARHGYQLVFTGTRGEEPIVDQVRAGLAGACSLVGQLDLGELAALLSLAPLLVANNTGPVHVAAAVGTPVVDLYALTNPQHTPWGVPCRVLSHDVPCKWCFKSVCPEGHHDCLRRVAPQTVVDAALELLREEPQACAADDEALVRAP